MPTTEYHAVRDWLKDGDVAAFNGGGLLGRLYKFTHCEVVKWNRDRSGYPKSLMLCGFREFQGARMVTLSSQVRKYPGRISIFRPRCDSHTAWSAAELLARQSGKRYSWWTIAVAFLWHLTLIRFLTGWKPGPDDANQEPNKWSAAKVCSSGVVWAFRAALGKRRISEWPCRHLPTWRVKPQDIAEDSAFFELLYEGLVLEGEA